LAGQVPVRAISADTFLKKENILNVQIDAAENKNEGSKVKRVAL
jgi:hypothetical protein